MLEHFFLNNFDGQIAALFLSVRSGGGIIVSTIISFLGNWQFLVPVTMVILLILFVKNKKRFIIPFALVIAGTEIVVFFAKLGFHRARPLAAVLMETDFSFPSGHAAIAVAFYGYLSYILIRLLKGRYRRLIIALTVLLIILIGLSRLYLGVHYASDVLAGYLIGSAALIIGVNLYVKT